MGKILGAFSVLAMVVACMGLFVLSGVGALVVTLATVGGQAIRAAAANPVDALRYE